jgi:hypothetical protein
VLNSQTLARQYMFLVTTNTATGAEDKQGAEDLAYDLGYAARPRDFETNPPPLVFVQSIGKPTPGPDGWQAAAATIQRLGGTPLAFLNLDGKSDYSLVGSIEAGPAAAEGSTVLGAPGAVSGVLSPSHNLGYLPLVAGPVGDVSMSQFQLEYQAATPFPAVNSAAELWIGKKVSLCGDTSTSCSFPKLFSSKYSASLTWGQVATDLAGPKTDYPGDGHGFTAAEYSATRTQLADEVSMFIHVRDYFTAMQDAFGKSGRDDQVNVDDLGQEIYAQVQPPGGNQALSFGLGLVSKIFLLGGFAGPPVSTVTAGLSAVFGLGAYVTGQPGDDSLASTVRVRADQLVKQIQGAITTAIYNFETEGKIIVTDYGKLRTAARYLADGDWKLPESGSQFVPTLREAVRTWFAQSLVPVTYAWMIRGTPPPLGPDKANNIGCDTLGPSGHRTDYYPWFAMPANAQYRAIQGWGTDGRPFLPTFFFSRWPIKISIDKTDEARRNSISESLANTLFGHGHDQLGINLIQFISPRYFGALHNANAEATDCDLFK